MTQVMTRRVALIACGVIAAVAISAMLVVGLFMIVTRDTRQDINLADLNSGSYDDPALRGYANATDELCRNVDGCIQGYRADDATYRKFTNRDAAAIFASSLPDTYQSNWIVIEYTNGSLAKADRDSIQKYIDTLNTSD